MIRETLPILAICLLLSGTAQAGPELELLLLSPDKAILRVDGARRVISLGETSPDGVTLVSVTDSVATVIVGEEVQQLSLARTQSYAPSTRADEDNETLPKGPPEHRIYANNDGMFQTAGSVNGFPVSFLVDTGASTVVLNGNQGRRLGLDHRMKGKMVTVVTASGLERGYQVSLRSVKIGQIELINVDAIVVDGPYPPEALLGMSFLGQLESEHSPNLLVLRKLH